MAKPKELLYPTKNVKIFGWCWLPMHFLLLSALLQSLAALLKISYTTASLNFSYFFISALVVIPVFFGFLIKSFPVIFRNFWNFLQALILAAVLYLAAYFLLQFLYKELSVTVTVFNNDVIAALTEESPAVMLICSVILMPIVEECLFRGAVFGSIHPKSRVLAYILSALLFAALHVLPYYEHGFGAIFATGLMYLPAGFSFAWAYSKSGTIWTSILLHALLNAVAYGLLFA